MVDDEYKNMLPTRRPEKRSPHRNLGGHVEPGTDQLVDRRDGVTDIRGFESNWRVVENALVRTLIRIRIECAQHLVRR